MNYIYQPQERLDQGIGELDPGQTFWTDYYRLVPEITGISISAAPSSRRPQAMHGLPSTITAMRP